jgi:hypothetical protein
MATEMSKIKATANAHMQRDIRTAARKWTCQCDDCREMRSLVGMEKLLDVRPLVREIGDIEEQMQNMPDSPELQGLMQRYLALHDQLAGVMAKQ